MYFCDINVINNMTIEMKGDNDKEIKYFIDESGDFGFVKGSSDLYAVSFTLHESSNSIETELKYLNEKLDTLNYGGKDFRHIINLLKNKRI